MKSRFRALVDHPALLLAVPLLLTVLAYARVLDGEFQFDDEHAIKANPAVKDLGGFLSGGFVGGFSAGGRPVTDLTFAMNYAVGGLETWNFHVTNLAIHLAAVVLVWMLVRELLRLAGAGRGEWVALGVAGAFALHPLQTQAVSYVVQRSEALSSALYVASLLLIVAAERRGLAARAWGWLAGGWVLHVLALGSKAIAVTLPAAWLLALAILPSAEERVRLASWKRRLVVAAPFMGASFLHAWLTIPSAGEGVDAGFAVPGLTQWSYLLTQTRVVATYVRLLFFPAGLNVDWDFPPSSSLAEPSVILSAAFLIALVALATWLSVGAGRRLPGESGAAARAAGFGVFWFFLLLAPTSSLVPIADVLMEHRVYLASVGAFLAVAVAVERLSIRAARVPPGAAAVALALVWASLCLATHVRNAVWVSIEALWADSASKSPHKPRPLTNLAYAVAKEGRLEESLRLNQAALKLVPARGDQAARILEDIAANQLSLGRPWEAKATLEDALRIGFSSDAFETLSATYLALGDVGQAERAAQRAMTMNPRNAEAWATASDVADRDGRKAEALARAQRAVALDPDLPGAWFSLGQALHGLGRDAEACAVWNRVGPAGGARLAFLRAKARCFER